MPSSPQSHHSSHSQQKRKRKHSSSEQNDSLFYGDNNSNHKNQKNKQQSISQHKKNNDSQYKRDKRSRSRDKKHKHKHRSHNSHHHRDHQKRDERSKQYIEIQKVQQGSTVNKQGNSNIKNKQSHYQTQNLSFYDHLYFLQDQNSKVSVQVAIWNTIIVHGYRPKKFLLYVKTKEKLQNLLKYQQSIENTQLSIKIQNSKNLQQKLLFRDIKLLTKSYDIIFMTQQKSSITLGLDQGDITLFDIVVNYGKSYSIEYYSLLPQFLGQNGIIFTIFQDKKQLQRHEKKLKLNFKQISNIEITQSQIEKQIFNQLQLQKPTVTSNQISNTSSSSLSAKQLQNLILLKSLPFSLQQLSIKLFKLVKQKYQPKKSIYNKRQGYITFCLKTDTQFNSIKYIWNFIREQMSPSVVRNIRDMKKFQNQRGVLFNIPFSDISKWQNFQSKIQKNQKKYKGYRLYQWLNQQLPKLQDTQSQSFKLLQLKKQEALKKRYQLQLFIAGVPYDVNQVQIRKFFADKQINLFMIRILRDGSGFSKGIAFGLAENQEHFDRAIKLNGQKFGDRQLRIKLADQRDK